MTSINAPARGATYDCYAISLDEETSIHAPVRGATGSFEGLFDDFDVLQSTLPYRERQRGMDTSLASCSFNPRSRTGSDSKSVQNTIIEFDRKYNYI